MDPSMVDERMRATWGRRYTPQDTEDYLKRSPMCDLQSWNQRAAKYPARSLEHPTLVYHAGMLWVREEGFQGLRTLSVETGQQFICPLCRQPATFARKYSIG